MIRCANKLLYRGPLVLLVMKNKTLLTVAAFVIALVFAAPAQAQRNLGICVEWNPDLGSTFNCDLEAGSGTGTTTVTEDNVFSIAMNSSGSVTNVLLIVLVPNATPTFTAKFTQTSVGTTGFVGPVQTDPGAADSFNFVTNDLLVASIQMKYATLNILAPVSEGVDWHYNSIANVSLVSVTSYSVYVFDTTFGLSGIAADGTTIMVEMDGIFPAGTIFTAIGLDPGSDFVVTEGMPLTLMLQVPEPGSLTLLGSGLFALGFLRRKQLFS